MSQYSKTTKQQLDAYNRTFSTTLNTNYKNAFLFNALVNAILFSILFVVNDYIDDHILDRNDKRYGKKIIIHTNLSSSSVYIYSY